MDSRQRILTAFAHKQPDRCPNFIWINDDTMEDLVNHLGVSSAEEAKRKLGVDRWADVGVSVSFPREAEETIDSLVPEKYKGDERFQVMDSGRVARLHEDVDYLEDTVFYPLGEIESKEELDGYPFPKESWLVESDQLERVIENYKKEGFVVSGGVAQPFKSAWLLRGMQNVLMDYLRNPQLISEIYDRIYSFATAKALRLVEKGVDMIKIVGDLGMQRGLMMNPDTWREFDKPRLKEMIGKWKEANPDLYVYMHTDGDVKAIISDLIEVGVDILNPIQPECMDPVKVKKKYGDELVLHGAVSLQRTLPFGSPREVKDEVRYLIENCNVDGGFVVGPSNVLFKEIPLENIVALYQAVY